MQTTIVKSGNRHGIRIPINVMEHKTIRERLTEFYGRDFTRKRKPQKEIDWGIPAGKEVW